MSSDKAGIDRVAKNQTLANKVDRALCLLRETHDEYGDQLVVANSPAKDSSACLEFGTVEQLRDPRVHHHDALHTSGEDVSCDGRDWRNIRAFKIEQDIAAEPHKPASNQLLKMQPTCGGHRREGRELLGHWTSLHEGEHIQAFRRWRSGRGFGQAQLLTSVA
jgi:hypothetical protein